MKAGLALNRSTHKRESRFLSVSRRSLARAWLTLLDYRPQCRPRVPALARVPARVVSRASPGFWRTRLRSAARSRTRQSAGSSAFACSVELCSVAPRPLSPGDRPDPCRLRHPVGGTGGVRARRTCQASRLRRRPCKGSSVFNVLVVLGPAALIDLPLMMAAAFACVPISAGGTGWHAGGGLRCRLPTWSTLPTLSLPPSSMTPLTAWVRPCRDSSFHYPVSRCLALGAQQRPRETAS
jgi:hypothetical protein